MDNILIDLGAYIFALLGLILALQVGAGAWPSWVGRQHNRA